MSISDELRKAIRDQPASPNRIGNLCGLDNPSMSRFMNGGNMTLAKADRIAKLLGLRLTRAEHTIEPVKLGRPKSS